MRALCTWKIWRDAVCSVCWFHWWVEVIHVKTYFSKLLRLLGDLTLNNAIHCNSVLRTTCSYCFVLCVCFVIPFFALFLYFYLIFFLVSSIVYYTRNATALGSLIRPRAVTRCNLAVSDMYMRDFGKTHQIAYTYCSVGISDLKPLTGTSADQLPHRKSQSLATA